jgi:HAE1 family hydrophobic/amphiphilic exporter-1
MQPYAETVIRYSLYRILPVITIVTVYPGAGASEVETSVTKKIEDAVSSLENLDKINSLSREGVSVITVQFKENTDVNRSVQDAQRKINAMKSSLCRTRKTESCCDETFL